jgi:hypothetical protein
LLTFIAPGQKATGSSKAFDGLSIIASRVVRQYASEELTKAIDNLLDLLQRDVVHRLHDDQEQCQATYQKAATEYRFGYSPGLNFSQRSSFNADAYLRSRQNQHHTWRLSLPSSAAGKLVSASSPEQDPKEERPQPSKQLHHFIIYNEPTRCNEVAPQPIEGPKSAGASVEVVIGKTDPKHTQDGSEGESDGYEEEPTVLLDGASDSDEYQSPLSNQVNPAFPGALKRQNAFIME